MEIVGTPQIHVRDASTTDARLDKDSAPISDV